MKTAKKKLIWGLLVVTAIFVSGSVLVFRDSIFESENYVRPLNVFVVSACSVRQDHIGIHDLAGRESKTPKIDAWAKGGYVFDNAIAALPWENFGTAAFGRINLELLTDNGFYWFRRKRGFHFFVPPADTTENGEEWFWSEKAILSYQDSMNELKSALLKRRPRATFIFTHLKYMHYPYLDDVNMGPRDFKKLSPRSQELLKKYLAAPASYDVQLPLIELMLNSYDLLKKKFGVNEKVLSAAGVISDRRRAIAWMKSPSYSDDLTLAKELYDLKLSKFDDMAADVLNLFGDKELQKNTVVIFMGDHGEALMDHGVLGHSVNVYDEMVRYPMVVKFPDDIETHRISGQINHKKMTELVRAIITGEITRANFAEKAPGYTSDYVMSRNCADTIRSVRFKSEWKLIKNLDSGKDELYDLKKDPKETNNVVEQNPEIAWRLEEFLIKNQEELHELNDREVSNKVCL